MNFRFDKKSRRVFEGKKQIPEINKFLSALELRGLSEYTIRSYAYDLIVLYKWLFENGKQLKDINQAELVEFIKYQKEKTINPKTINHRLVTAELLYRFISGHELKPAAGVALPGSCFTGRGNDRNLGIYKLNFPKIRKLRIKEPLKLIEPLTCEQVCNFFKSLKRYRDLSIVQLMLLSGLRSSEILNILVEDISYEDASIRVRGKGNKQRIIPISDIFIETIKKYISFERPRNCQSLQMFVVLQGSKKGMPMTPSGLRNLFRYRRRNPKISNANAHRFRHTFGADMARSGVNLPVIQRLMGHAHTLTTMKYINLSMSDVAKDFAKASSQIQTKYFNWKRKKNAKHN